MKYCSFCQANNQDVPDILFCAGPDGIAFCKLCAVHAIECRHVEATESDWIPQKETIFRVRTIHIQDLPPGWMVKKVSVMETEKEKEYYEN